MRNAHLFLLSAFCILLNAALFGVSDNSQEAVKHLQVLESTATHTLIQFNLPEYEIQTEEINGIPFKKLDILSDALTLEEGLPELPIYSTLIAIPYQGSATLEVVDKQSFRIDNFVPVPVQPDPENNRSFAFDADFYNSDTTYPYVSESISEPMIIRDFRVVSLTSSPIRYNPQTRSLEVTESVTYRINYANAPSVNEMNAPISYSPGFEPLYRKLISNYEEVLDRTIPAHNKRLLIIYGACNDSTYQAKLAEFIKWKKQKGYYVRAISTADCGQTNSQVKAEIQIQYNNHLTRPEYVLLIGDVSGALPIECWTHGGGATDYPYTHLAGDDLLGDVFIGRMPVENVTQFLTMANKVFTYERDPIIEPAEWYNHMLLVGFSNIAGQSVIYLNKFMKHAALNINPNYTFTEFYGIPSGTLMQQAINQGVAFFVYRGWMGMNSWDYPSEPQFTNGNKMPHCIINTCATGNFNGTDATDSIVRYGTPSQPKGAITAIGMSTSSCHTLMNNVLSGQIIDSIFNWGMRDMSGPLLTSKIFISMLYNETLQTMSNNHAFWCNLMGDPTVEVLVGTPQSIVAEYLESVSPGQNGYSVHAEDTNGNPLEGALVTLVNDTGMQRIAETDAYGNANIGLPYNFTDSPSFTLTVSKHDYVPVYEEIEIINSIGITVAALTIIDAMGGDNDAIADAGETINFNLTLANPGVADIVNPTIILSSEDPYLEISQNSAVFNTIPAGGTSTGSQVYQVHIAENTPSYYNCIFKLEVLNQDYSTYHLLNILNGDIIVAGIALQDNNGILEQGETTALLLTIVNAGGQALTNLNVDLSCESNLISIDDNHTVYPFLANADEVDNSDDLFTITARNMPLSGYIVELTAHFYNAAGFEEYETFLVPTGTPTLSSPTGPDNFGHYIYHSNDTSSPNAPVYEWIGITPDEGGNGSLFSSIVDTGVDPNEGDITGADTIDSTDLPFTFTFYGRDYDEVYVCSNGFMTFVPTEVGTFRNYPIPGPLCPDPLIAPFWDDLFFQNGSNGGVFFWYNEISHYFVIEWYNATNGYEPYNPIPEQFEVILYDPIYYPTSTGDGKIKIQYHTFNDIDEGDTFNYPPWSGHYSTVGISDHTGTDGIQYLFNQVYAPTAQQLADGTAILITGEPMNELSYILTIDDVLFCDFETGNGNSVPDPGEQFTLCVNITNQSQFEFENVGIDFSCSDESVVIGEFNSIIPRIPPNSIVQSWVPVTVPVGVPIGTAFSIPVSIQAPGYEEATHYMNIVTGYEAGLSTSIGVINGTISVDVGTPDLTQTLINDELFLYAGVSPEGEYKFFSELERTYNLASYLTHYAPGIMNNIVLTATNPVSNDNDVVMELLPEPTGLIGFLNDYTLNLMWIEPTECGYPLLNYNVYRSQNEEDFELIASPTAVEYQDVLLVEGLYSYYVEAFYNEGISYPSTSFTINVTTGNEEDTPFTTKLDGNYPNPFNPTTNISYSLAEEGKVNISIYNIRGQLVRTLLNEQQDAGQHVIQWNGKDDYNNDCATGLYMYRFKAQDLDVIRKALMLK